MLVKKELASVPVLPVPKMPKENKYRVAVSKVMLPRSGEILVVDFFTSRKLDLRFFSDGVKFATARTWPVETWSACNPRVSLMQRGYSATPEAEQLARDFLKPKRHSYYAPGVMGTVDVFVSCIGEEKRQRAAESKDALQKKHFAMYPELPSNLEEYCDRWVFGHAYILIGKLDKKGRRPGLCTHCGERFDAGRKARTGQATTCPKCGRKAIYKASWQNPRITDEAKICIAHKVDGQLLLRWVEVKRTFEEPQYIGRYEFEDYAYNLHLVENGTCKLYFYKWLRGYMCYWYDWYRGAIGDICYDHTYIYTDNLGDVFGDRYYNVNLKASLEGKSIQIQFSKLLNNLRDNPAAEYLFKHGMPRLAAEADKLGVDMECEKPSFFNVMGVSGQYMDMYSGMDVSVQEHRIIKAYGKWVSPEDLKAYRELNVPDDSTDTAIGLLRDVSFKRFVHYFAKQKKVAKRKMSYLLIQYRDYINMSIALGVDLSHKSTRFPQNIIEAHAQIVPRFNKIAHEAADKTFKNAVKPLYEQLRVTQFEQAGFCIVLPQLRSDLIAEGQSLNHCVGGESYYKNHIAGTSMIFFVRKAIAPEKPFFTMEVDMIDYRIKQLYGFGDCSAPKEVRRFADAYVRRLRPGAERRAS